MSSIRLRHNPSKRVPFELPEDTGKNRSPMRHRTTHRAAAPVRRPTSDMPTCRPGEAMGHPAGYRRAASGSSSSTSSSSRLRGHPNSISEYDDEDSVWFDSPTKVLSLLLLVGLVWYHSNVGDATLSSFQETSSHVLDYIGDLPNQVFQMAKKSYTEEAPPPTSKLDQLLKETMEYIQSALDN